MKDEKLDQIKADRNYSYEDQITCSQDCLPDYEEKVRVLSPAHVFTSINGVD